MAYISLPAKLGDEQFRNAHPVQIYKIAQLEQLREARNIQRHPSG